MQKQIYLFSISSHSDALSINSLAIDFLKPDIDFSKYDSFIITSKQASNAIKQYNSEEYINLPALCISKQSAISYEAIGGKVLDIGEGYGNTLIEKIRSYPKSKKWLYLRAEIVASDFVNICKKDGYNIDEAIIYKSSCSKEILEVEIDEDSILIFTSPSSLKCFLKNHNISKRSKIIVIGKTTAKMVPEGIKYYVSDKTTVDSCIKLAKTL